MNDNIIVIYKVLHTKPKSREDHLLSKSSKYSWSSLMHKVCSNKYTDITNSISKIKRDLSDYELKQFTVESLLPILDDNNTVILGKVDLVSSSFLFDRSPLDLQLFILAGMGITSSQLLKCM